MSVSIAVVCEARADQRTATGLADRIIYDAADWITPGVVDDYRTYRGYLESEPLMTWMDSKRRAQELGLAIRGHFSGQPGALDAQAARRALHVLKASNRAPDAVLLVRDDDRLTERRKGLEQARDEARSRGWKAPIVIGLAHVMRESWVLSGFVAGDPSEQTRLDAARTDLGFDPTVHPDRLTAKKETAKRSAKRVLRFLTSGDGEREAACWIFTELQVLRARGLANGLASYLDELCQHLPPLFGASVVTTSS